MDRSNGLNNLAVPLFPSFPCDWLSEVIENHSSKWKVGQKTLDYLTLFVDDYFEERDDPRSLAR
jgi:hypothetical protein